MRIASIRSMDISNGAGIGVSIFTAGCRLHCQSCHNPKQWDFMAGEPYTEDMKNQILALGARDWVERFSILGGEPLEPENQAELAELVTAWKELYPHKLIWLYTGNTLEKLQGEEDTPYRTEFTDQILSTIDVLVDGPFILAKKNPALRFSGSTNQRVIDMVTTRTRQSITLWSDDPIYQEHEKEQMASLESARFLHDIKMPNYR